MLFSSAYLVSGITHQKKASKWNGCRWRKARAKREQTFFVNFYGHFQLWECFQKSIKHDTVKVEKRSSAYIIANWNR